jgi:allantoin racemase
MRKGGESGSSDIAGVGQQILGQAKKVASCKKISVIVPVITDVWNETVKSLMDKYKEPGTTIEIINLHKGSVSIESAYDAAWSALNTVQAVEQAEQDGSRGVILYCFEDPALQAAKEAVKIPVVGLGEATYYFAGILGPKFGLITANPTDHGNKMNNLRSYELDHKCVGIDSVGVPVLQLKENDRLVEEAFVTCAQRLIQKGADVIIIGCGSLLWIADSLSQTLGVPVVLPAAAALKSCESLISLGLSQSKRAFPLPSVKTRVS